MHSNKDFAIHLEHALNSQTSLPVLSPEVMKIQSEAMKKDPHFSVLASLIRKDPTLTSQILKIANSPLYRGFEDAETLKDALTRLGQSEMVNIIMTVVHKQNFRSQNPMIRSYQKQLWSHSLNCALGTLWTARYLSLKELIPNAFIAGLLHDMGKLHILAALEKVLNAPGQEYSPSSNAIEDVIGQLHSSFGYKLLIKWHLPEQYATIARDHHSGKFDSSNYLLTIVRFVNTMCREIEKNDNIKILNLPEAQILNMTDSGISELETEIKKNMVLQ